MGRTATPRRLAHLLLAALLWSPGCRRTLSPDAEPPAHNPTPAYRQMLSRVVVDGYVDYDRLEAERETLEAYVAWLGRDELWEGSGVNRRLGLHLNAYTAFTLYRVLEEGRPQTVERWVPRPGLTVYFEPQFKLGPDHLSLSEIAHERVRLAEMDPRVHAALGCAAMSCPPVRGEPWASGSRLHHQLREHMTAWVDDDARGVRIEGDVAVFSPVFDWFARDFIFWSAGKDLCALTAHFASDDKRAQLVTLGEQGCPHRFFELDGRLNSVQNAAAAGRGTPQGRAPLVR